MKRLIAAGLFGLSVFFMMVGPAEARGKRHASKRHGGANGQCTKGERGGGRHGFRFNLFHRCR